MAFSVQWTKEGKVIHNQPMTGETMDEVAKAALQETSRVVETTGQQPDQLRVIDHERRQGALYPLKKVSGTPGPKAPDEPPAVG